MSAASATSRTYLTKPVSLQRQHACSTRNGQLHALPRSAAAKRILPHGQETECSPIKLRCPDLRTVGLKTACDYAVPGRGGSDPMFPMSRGASVFRQQSLEYQSIIVETKTCRGIALRRVPSPPDDVVERCNQDDDKSELPHTALTHLQFAPFNPLPLPVHSDPVPTSF